MPIRTTPWKVGSNPQPLAESSLAKEQLLEAMIVTEPRKLSDEWMLNLGISREEILEIIMHASHCGGWPCGANAIRVAMEVFSTNDPLDTKGSR